MPEIETALTRLLTTLGFALAGAVLLFGIKVVLTRYLRNRTAPGLVPKGGPDALSRLFSLIGHRAAPQETMGLRRLRATVGLKLLFWGVTAAMVVIMAAMRAPIFGIESLLLCVALYFAAHTSFYEISYDREMISLPRWWFGKTTRKWRDLEAVVERRGWYLDFHFRGGTVVQTHKYVVGYAGLRDKAEAVLREV